MKDAQYKLIVDAARERGATFPTSAAWLKFKAAIDNAVSSADSDYKEPAPEVSSSPAKTGLRFAQGFFDTLRQNKLLGPTLTPHEVDGCSAITSACGAANWPISWTAYALATAYLETAHTMQPIKEYGGTSYFHRMYDIGGQRPHKARELGNTQPGDGCKYCGRGYVQLTGKANYAKAGLILNQPLVTNPDLAMQPDIAADIMVLGMQEGWFTGKSCNTYLPKTGPAGMVQFKSARRIINGQDRADDVAAYALDFQKALGAGQWG